MFYEKIRQKIILRISNSITYQAFQTSREVLRTQCVSILSQVQIRQILQSNALRHGLPLTLDNAIVLDQKSNMITNHIETFNVS